MAIVFSRDLLFVHVPKTGGSSVTAYLREVLAPPVYYMAPGPLGRLDRDGAIYLPGQPHQSLAAIRRLVHEHGFRLEAFPAIIAVVRNPYDLVVSDYAFHRQVSVPYELIDEPRPPRPPPRPELDDPEFRELVLVLSPGKVARIEPGGKRKANAIRISVWRAAARLQRPVEIWDHDDVLYVALAPLMNSGLAPPRGAVRLQALAEQLAFRDFVLDNHRSGPRSWLSQLYGFYHLDGAVPPNLRILPFERLAEGIRDVLRSIGITAKGEFPWLNRSAHESTASYYDAETEAAVYARARWMFDQGLYDRLDLFPSSERGSA